MGCKGESHNKVNEADSDLLSSEEERLDSCILYASRRFRADLGADPSAGTGCAWPPSRHGVASWPGQAQSGLHGAKLPALQAVPGGEDEAGGAVLAEALDLVSFEHSEGFGRIVRTLHASGVEDVAQLVAGEAIGARVPSVELGLQMRTTILLPGTP